MLVGKIEILHLCESMISGENSLLVDYTFDAKITPVFPFIHSEVARAGVRYPCAGIR